MNILRFLRLHLFANHAAADGETGFANQIVRDDGKAPEWVEIPYGHHDHKNGMQIFDRESAEQIVANFKSLLGERTFGGLPWYVGHPDVAEFANAYKDRSARGWVKNMEATDAGLRLRVKWNAAGEAVIANEEFKYFSPVWGCSPVPGKARQFRPARMKSVGFTNEPNIGVMPLSNANEKTNNNMDLKKLAALLGLDPETATEESCTTALNALLEAGKTAKELPKEIENEKTARSIAETALANETTARTAAETRATGAETSLAAERRARIDLVLDAAIRDGRITAAQRPAWANELGAAFDAKLTELANVKPSVHTDAKTKNLGQRKEVKNAADEAVLLANERCAKNGGNWDAAWNSVRNERPDLFEKMKTATA